MNRIGRCLSPSTQPFGTVLICTTFLIACGGSVQTQNNSTRPPRDFPRQLNVQYRDQEIQGDATGFCHQDTAGGWRCEDFWSEKYGARHFIAYSLGDTGHVMIDAPVELSEVEIEYASDGSQSTELEAAPWKFEAPQESGYYEYTVCAVWSRGHGCWVFGVKVVGSAFWQRSSRSSQDGG